MVYLWFKFIYLHVAFLFMVNVSKYTLPYIVEHLGYPHHPKFPHTVHDPRRRRPAPMLPGMPCHSRSCQAPGVKPSEVFPKKVDIKMGVTTMP